MPVIINTLLPAHLIYHGSPCTIAVLKVAISSLEYILIHSNDNNLYCCQCVTANHI